MRSYDSYLPPSSVSKLSVFLSLPVSRRSSLLPGEGGRWGRAWSQIIRPQDSLALNKSFNTLCQGAQTRTICAKCSAECYVYYSYLNKGSSPALSLSSLSGKLKLPTFKVRIVILCLRCYREPRSQNEIASWSRSRNYELRLRRSSRNYNWGSGSVLFTTA